MKYYINFALAEKLAETQNFIKTTKYVSFSLQSYSIFFMNILISTLLPPPSPYYLRTSTT